MINNYSITYTMIAFSLFDGSLRKLKIDQAELARNVTKMICNVDKVDLNTGYFCKKKINTPRSEVIPVTAWSAYDEYEAVQEVILINK